MHDGFDGHHGFDERHDFDRGEHLRFGFGPDFSYDGDYPEGSGDQASGLLLPKLRRVLPERDELPGGVGAGTGFMTNTTILVRRS
jgi:hypothetical protein